MFVYSSIHAINASKLGQFSKLKERFSADDDYFTFRSYNLSSIVDWLTDADQSTGVPEVKLTVYNPGRLATPYETIYGLIKLSDIATLYKVHGKQLVVANIRAYKGDTEVNAGIVTTLRDMPEAFVYLNNGLTAYCERFNVFHADRGKSECKRITAHGFSVVNGAQTLGAINYRFTEAQAETQEGYVFIKLISLERCENDVEFAQLITRTANYQNRIDLEHFIAQQPYQQEIARRLRFSDIYYHFRDDVETPTSDEYNFTLKDATTALACVDQMKDCDFVARIIANRKSLLSLDIDYPDDALYKTRYSRVFKTDRSARTVWRAVQTQMVVIDKMKENVRASSGVRKSFFETARWLVLNLIFLQLKPEQGDELALTTGEMGQIGDRAIEYAELLWGVCETLGYVARQADGLGYEQPRHFRTIFSNATDCARLRGAVLARLNEKKR